MSISNPNNKEHQLLNRKRYSPRESHDYDSSHLHYTNMAHEQKKEEGELIGYNAGERNERYKRQSNYKREYTQYHHEKEEKNEKFEKYDKSSYFNKEERYQERKIYLPRKMNNYQRRDYSRDEESSYRRQPEDFRKKDYNRERLPDQSYKRTNNRREPAQRKYSKDESRIYSSKSEREYGYNNEKSSDNFRNYSNYREDSERRMLPPTMKKKFNFLIVLPKNYFSYIEREYNLLHSEIKKRVRDIDFFQYDHKIPNFQEYLLRIDAAKVSAKAYAMKIVCEVLFDCMKETYKNMTYLKVSILVPSRILLF